MQESIIGGAKRHLQNLLASRGLRPQKFFGQNFLLDGNLLDFIAGHASADDCVLEVGPGTGALTEKLLATGAEIIAVEIDRGLCGLLRSKFADRKNFTLIEGDILATKHELNQDALATVREKFLPRTHQIENENATLGKLKCIANLPYAAGTPFIVNLCADNLPWDFAVVMVQYEVATRMLATAGDDDYGGLTAKVAMAGNVKILRKVHGDAFYPPPDVDSALTRIDFFSPEIRGQIAWKQFDELLKLLFSSRRKTLRKALKSKFSETKIAEILAAENLTGDERAENLPPQKLYALSKLLLRPSYNVALKRLVPLGTTCLPAGRSVGRK